MDLDSIIPAQGRAVALKSFQSQDTAKLSFVQGDVIQLVAKHPLGWWNGWLHNGPTRQMGWFPASHVQCTEEHTEDQPDNELFSLAKLAWFSGLGSLPQSPEADSPIDDQDFATFITDSTGCPT
jgi:hypothetical protein